MADWVDTSAYPWPLAEPLWRHGVQSHVDLISPPSIEPVLLADAKLHLRVTHSAEDTYISRLIVAVRRQCETYTRRSIMPQTLRLVMDRFPRGGPGWGLSGLVPGGVGSSAIIRVPKPPILSIQSITYIDTDGNEQNLDGSPAFYQVDLPVGPHAGYGRIRPLDDNVWPDVKRRTLDAVKVTFRAGYTDSNSPPNSPPQVDVPADLIQGMFLGIGELYKTRTESVNDYMIPALRTARSMWAAYRVF